MLYSLLHCLPPTNLTCNLLLLETLLYLPPFIMFSSSFCVQKLSTICTVTLCECVILCNNESLALLSNNNPQLLKVFHFVNVAKWQTVLASKFYFNIPTNTDVPYYVFFQVKSSMSSGIVARAKSALKTSEVPATTGGQPSRSSTVGPLQQPQQAKGRPETIPETSSLSSPRYAR